MTATAYYDSHAEVDSTALTDVYHDSLTNSLYVEFTSGSLAGYSGVDQHFYDELINASSVGRYYIDNIKYHCNVLSADVLLVERPSQPKSIPTPGSVRFEVVIKIDGDLKLRVSAADFGDASDQVTKFLNEITTAKYTVQSVTKSG